MARTIRRKPFKFAYDIAAYSLVSDMRESHTRKELLAEYNRMRAEAVSRMKELKDSKYNTSAQYLTNVGRFRGGSKMNKTQLAHAMRDAARFLSASTSTVQGMREYERKSVNTWRNVYGYSFINANNVDEWGYFLEWVKESNLDPYDLDEVAKQFRAMENYRRKSADKQLKAKAETRQAFNDFQEWRREKAEYAEAKRRADRISSEDLRRRGY
mgnify:CR=1 FL=1